MAKTPVVPIVAFTPAEYLLLSDFLAVCIDALQEHALRLDARNPGASVNTFRRAMTQAKRLQARIDLSVSRPFHPSSTTSQKD